MAEFRMPSLGADMEAGTLVEWRVKPGDVVAKGDIVAVVETEKSTIEVEVFTDGTVTELLVDEGQRVPVGTPLALVAEPGRPSEPVAPSPAAVGAPTEDQGAVAVEEDGATVASPLIRRRAKERGVDLDDLARSIGTRHVTRADVEAAEIRPARRVSPRARQTARRLGVETGALVGTGPGGSVVAADVERAAARSEGPERARPATTAPDGMRRAIARLMARSAREIPHYYLSEHVDLKRAATWLTAENERRPVTRRLLLPAVLLKAVALAVREVPEVNGFWRDDGLQPSEAIHLGLAISLRGGGLVAPAVHGTDRRSLDELMEVMRDLVARARAGTLRSSEMADPTLTVTNLGDQGVEAVYGVIVPPQVALVGFGRVHHEPVAVDGRVEVHPVVLATLAADHRATDGHRGGRFLAALAHLLQTPEEL